MSPDHLIVSHGGFHLLVNVKRVIRKVYSGNPNGLMSRALYCANEKTRNIFWYSVSSIDQLDKPKPCKFWDSGSKYCRVPDYLTGVTCSQLVRIIDKCAFEQAMHIFRRRVFKRMSHGISPLRFDARLQHRVDDSERGVVSRYAGLPDILGHKQSYRCN